jgi:hypothetical protein
MEKSNLVDSLFKEDSPIKQILKMKKINMTQTFNEKTKYVIKNKYKIFSPLKVKEAKTIYMNLPKRNSLSNTKYSKTEKNIIHSYRNNISIKDFKIKRKNAINKLTKKINYFNKNYFIESDKLYNYNNYIGRNRKNNYPIIKKDMFTFSYPYSFDKIYRKEEKLIPIHSEKIMKYTENYFNSPNKNQIRNTNLTELIPDIQIKKKYNNYILFEMNKYYQKKNKHFKI